MKTNTNDNAIQEQNRALEDLHQLHVDDIDAVGEEIIRVELKHDSLSVSNENSSSKLNPLVTQGIHGPLGSRTARSESVRDLEFFFRSKIFSWSWWIFIKI